MNMWMEPLVRIVVDWLLRVEYIQYWPVYLKIVLVTAIGHGRHMIL